MRVQGGRLREVGRLFKGEVLMLTPARILDEHKAIMLIEGMESEDAIKVLAMKYDLREFDVRQVVVISTPELWEKWNPILMRKKVRKELGCEE